MVSQSIITLNKSLLELLKPSTSPEKALQLLSTSYITLEAYPEGDKEPAVIFLSYIRFVMKRKPDGIVQGIWEEILKKTSMYLRNDFCNLEYHIKQIRNIYPPNIFSWVVPTLRDKLGAWVVNILSNHSYHTSCPNPYVRLDIFRLLLKLKLPLIADYFDVRVYRREDEINLCDTFWYTICEVNPHRFFPSGDGYEPMFNAPDLDDMLRQVYNNISYEQIHDANFISKIIQLTEVFTTRIGNDPLQHGDILSCCSVLRSLKNISDRVGHTENMSDRVGHTELRNYVVEAVREITATVIFRWGGEAVPGSFHTISFRDDLVKDLVLSPNPCDLPRLLLLRQMNCPRQVHQHALLLPDLAPIFSTEDEEY